MKRVLYWLILLTIALLFFFPTLVSTSFGKPLFTKLLEQRTGAKISIGKVHLSWLGPQKFEKVTYNKPEVVGSADLFLSNVPFWAMSDLAGSFLVQNGAFSFPAYGDGSLKQVNAAVKDHSISATAVTDQGGHLSLQGKVFSKEDFDISADLKAIPTAALDQLLQAGGLVYAALGPTFDLSGTLLLNRSEGTAALVLSSPNATANLRAELGETTFTLTEPFLATLRLTPELTTALMSKAHLLAESKEPVILRILPNDFIFPYRPFALDELRIGQAMLDLGKVRIQNNKSLASLINLLKNSRLSETRDINAWFTPLHLRVQNGVVETGRMDALLADSIHICTWGDIDLQRDRLDMFLGLPADTLAQSFGIQNLPRNYVLKIPIRGSIKDPELVTGPATAKIAAMTAAQQIPKKGNLFGGLLQHFIQPKEDEEVPPPNRPFPWEK